MSLAILPLLNHCAPEEVREIEFVDLADAPREVVLKVHAEKWGKYK